MDDVDMFSWHANGEESFAMDTWGVGLTAPEEDQQIDGVEETSFEFDSEK